MSDLEHALPRGTRIAGYEITGCIGAGGFGITYTAFNKFTERQVAIKEFFPDGVASRSMASTELLVFDGQEETLRWALHKFEATTTDLCRLSHPNIVRVIDYYPGNRTGYMVMEYLRGMTLKEWLADRRRPPRPAELAPMLEPVLDALEYLHGLGLIHRDIAPDNIFICDDNRPVLIDFGAVSLDRSTQGSAARPTAIIKKRSFTAPDQARGMSLPNPTADVYSLGAVLYQALSGQPPVDGEDRMVGVLITGKDPYVSLEPAPPAATSRTMGRAIDQCLMVAANERPQTIKAARRLLDWSDDHAQRDTDHARFDDGLRLQDFSLARDVISSTLLDERDLVPDPPREIAPDPKLDPTNPPAKKRLVGKPWLVLLLATLLALVIGLAVFVGWSLRSA